MEKKRQIIDLNKARVVPMEEHEGEPKYDFHLDLTEEESKQMHEALKKAGLIQEDEDSMIEKKLEKDEPTKKEENPKSRVQQFIERGHITTIEHLRILERAMKVKDE